MMMPSPGVFTVVVADWSSPHGGNMMVLRRLGGLAANANINTM